MTTRELNSPNNQSLSTDRQYTPLFTLMITSAQVVEISVHATNSSTRDFN